MFPFFKKHDESTDDGDIVVVKKPAPNTCGGTYATQRKSAPTEIVSDEIVSFSVECSYRTAVFHDDTPEEENIRFISAFAVPAEGGTFLVLEKEMGYYSSRKPPVWAYVREDIFPELAAIVKEYDLAKGNGYHSNTAGLPENFGGSVDIRYAGGERIDYSDNQTPMLNYKAAIAIAKVFDKAIQGENIPLPDVETLEKVLFSEKRRDGGFVNAELTLNSDGTGVNRKQSRYDDPDKIFESEKPVEAEAVETIKKSITGCGMLAWVGLPENGYKQMYDKQLTFVFKDGREVTVMEDRLLPHSMSHGFFNIELEMTTKH